MTTKSKKLIKKLLEIARLWCKYVIMSFYLLCTTEGRQHLILSLIIWTTIIYKLIDYFVRLNYRSKREIRHGGEFGTFRKNNTYVQTKALYKYLTKYVFIQNVFDVDIYNTLYTWSNLVYNKYGGINLFYFLINSNIHMKYLIFCFIFLLYVFYKLIKRK